MNNRELFSKLDYTLIFIVFLLFCSSIIAIQNAPDVDGSSFAKRQIMWYTIGAIAALVVILFDYERLKNLHWFFYGFGILLLLGLTAAKLGVPVPFADESKGALSWYKLPGIGSLQPSEFMKIFLTLSLSQVIVKHNETHHVKSLRDDIWLLGKIAVVAGIPFFLVLIQPDLGTALVMAAIIAALVIISGIRWRILLILFLFVLLGLGFFAFCWFQFPEVIKLLLKGHQIDRFYGWLEPEQYGNHEGYQLIRSLYTIGPGQLYGTGLDSSSVSLPEAHTDFIFAVIAGGFGFVGAAVVISLFFMLIYRMIHAAIGTHDPFGSYICTGLIGMFTFQIFENIGMTIQVMPITGITLPFLSYGGSSLLTSLMAVGLILSIQSRTRKYMF
ncbi:cell division protein FtsW (lipid II flippase) [Scopulibacillus darangshiensis]|uniref:Cell division protein FtsW (Lipid II flippase) n=1 Tax=Scopulibacillus darangshiensis TaxID=442528 RepID=A0A4V2SL75_9BACL|nr:FtsW/RodA/SpoVE family cell cycle protein [Scopulibacillus darangshiensis]TCP22316.1 cell division protein FtsW (lipid II flippase) [Scopulibacillus darangshiensis]